MKKKKNVMYRKSVSLLAAAAMTAVLMTGQVQKLEILKRILRHPVLFQIM